MKKAIKISECLFNGNIKELNSSEILDCFKDVPSFEIEKEYSLIDLLVDKNICCSKREAREFLNSGSILINGDKVVDENMNINKEIAIDNKLIVVRRGKKKYYLGKF